MASLGLTLGALEIGVLISTVLYGISTVQTFLYMERNFKDGSLIRFMVGIVGSVDLAHTISIWAYLYELTVTNYGLPNALFGAPWSLALSLVCASIVSSSVQSFLAYRIRVLSGHLFIPLITWTLATLHLALGLALTTLVVKEASLPAFFARYQWLVTADLSLHVGVDVLNTSTLCFYLLSRRSGFKPTQKIVDKLILYTLENGLITSFCSTAVLICSLVMKTNLVYLSLFMIYPKLFSNSFLASLNARQVLRQKMGSMSDSQRVWSSGVSGPLETPGDAVSRTGAVELSPRALAHSKAVPSFILEPPLDYEVSKDVDSRW